MGNRLRLSDRFTKGIAAIKALETHPRYQAAFIFGSVAEGTATAKSDLDVRVVVDEDNDCTNVNHPVFDGYKLDLSFRSFGQIETEARADFEKRERRPVLAGAIIVFDKTGQLTALKTLAEKVQPAKYTSKDFLYTQFMLYHANDKVARCINEDPASALYSMHANIGDVLKYHYKLHGHWWVSSKRIFADLDRWDRGLAELVRQFVTAGEVGMKYGYWSAIMDHVTAAMGGRKSISENNCSCSVCIRDIEALGS